MSKEIAQSRAQRKTTTEKAASKKPHPAQTTAQKLDEFTCCLLYTSDAADE